jgi:hypothetical protein
MKIPRPNIRGRLPSLSVDVRIDDKSPAELAVSLWNGGASKAYNSKEAFVTSCARFYARKTGAGKQKANQIRRKMADAIAPNEELQFDAPVLPDGGDDEADAEDSA